MPDADIGVFSFFQLDIIPRDLCFFLPGNDQVRFEGYCTTLNPKLKMLAPVREWGMGRDEELAYAEKHKIPVKQTKVGRLRSTNVKQTKVERLRTTKQTNVDVARLRVGPDPEIPGPRSRGPRARLGDALPSVSRPIGTPPTPTSTRAPSTTRFCSCLPKVVESVCIFHDFHCPRSFHPRPLPTPMTRTCGRTPRRAQRSRTPPSPRSSITSFFGVAPPSRRPRSQQR